MRAKRRGDTDDESTPVHLHRGRYLEQLALFRRSEELYQRAAAQYRELMQSLPRDGVVGPVERTTAPPLAECGARDATPGAPGPLVLRPEDRAAPNRRRRSEPRRTEGDAGALTRRQREVAALIAAGKTNRDIAEDLVLVEGTVANHVEHILNRLNLRNRAQIGVWAVRHGLVDPNVEGAAEPDEPHRPCPVRSSDPIVPP